MRAGWQYVGPAKPIDRHYRTREAKFSQRIIDRLGFAENIRGGRVKQDLGAHR